MMAFPVILHRPVACLPQTRRPTTNIVRLPGEAGATLVLPPTIGNVFRTACGRRQVHSRPRGRRRPAGWLQRMHRRWRAMASRLGKNPGPRTRPAKNPVTANTAASAPPPVFDVHGVRDDANGPENAPSGPRIGKTGGRGSGNGPISINNAQNFPVPAL